MIPTAAPPVTGAALRLLRTAAGRRAPQASVLVGGVLALAFLYGGQAHAADGRTSTVPPTPVASVVERAAQPLLAAKTGARAGRPAGSSAERRRGWESPFLVGDPLPRGRHRAPGAVASGGVRD
ncbi:hypothetical protein ABZV34_14330 [Streptomyces sp. NPDC005195]|uniref:hypothetical protein n=1 Tax=Streptomyces sp. NPDC005195 TaxID=3154561 RepID=UPI0033B50ABA